MAVETPPQQQTPPENRSSDAFIISAIEGLRADVRQLYYLNILTLLTALGALITGLFTLLTR